MSSITLENDVIEKVSASKIDTTKTVATVVKRNYVLYELEAMRKKLSCQQRNPAVSIEREAKNGSTINVLVKTSLFEYTKVKLLDALKNDPEVVETKQTVTATAPSKHSGMADVEYQLECVYKASEHEHKVKITCYTTTCNLLVTNMAGKAELKSYLGNKSNSRHFAERFLKPFLTKAEEDFPNLDDKFIPLIRAEIQRIEKLENKKPGIKEPLLNGVTKCVYKGCRKGKSGNLNLSNKLAYGTCSLCKGHEHFTCSNTKDWRKLNIVNGIENYFCTNCYAKHHVSLTLQKHLEVNLGVKSVGYDDISTIDIEIEETIDAEQVVKAIVHSIEPLLIEDSETETSLDETSAPNSVPVKCNLCDEEYQSELNIRGHKCEKHETLVNATTNFKCDECSETYSDSVTLENHECAKQETSRNCDVCNKTFTVEADLNDHTCGNKKSTLNCDFCKETFSNNCIMKAYKCSKQQVKVKCDLCEHEGDSENEVEVHKKDAHVIGSCSYCDTFIDTKVLLRKHIETEHATIDNSKVTSNKEYVQQLVDENSKLAHELRTIKDDFERLSDICKKQTEEFNGQKCSRSEN